jgi:hypothetical protein
MVDCSIFLRRFLIPDNTRVSMDANRFASNTWAQLQEYEHTSNPR